MIFKCNGEIWWLANMRTKASLIVAIILYCLCWTIKLLTQNQYSGNACNMIVVYPGFQVHGQRLSGFKVSVIVCHKTFAFHRGEVAARASRVLLQMKVRQHFQNNSTPEIVGKLYSTGFHQLGVNYVSFLYIEVGPTEATKCFLIHYFWGFAVWGNLIWWLFRVQVLMDSGTFLKPIPSWLYKSFLLIFYKFFGLFFYFLRPQHGSVVKIKSSST